MREKILTFIEKNSRVKLKDLAIMLGIDEAAVGTDCDGRRAYYMRLSHINRLG